MAIEKFGFPSEFVVGDVFRLEYRSIPIDAATLVTRCNEGIEEVGVVQRIVEVGLTRRARIAFLPAEHGRRLDRSAEVKDLADVRQLEVCLGIARAHLKLEGAGQLVANLAEDAPALSLCCVFKRGNGEP